MQGEARKFHCKEKPESLTAGEKTTRKNSFNAGEKTDSFIQNAGSQLCVRFSKPKG